MNRVSDKTVPVSNGAYARERLLAGTPVMEVRREVAGVSTAMLECGAGSPVVLLHGQGAFAALWVPIMAGLAEQHRVIAPDLPGLGDSASAHGPLGPDAVAEWLRELIERTCEERPVLVGLSLGGQIAAGFAARDSDRLAGLVLVDTPGLVGKPRLRPGTLLALLRHSARPSRHSTVRLLRHLVVDVDRLRDRLGDRWEPFLDYMVDRARTPSVKQANRRLMSEIGLRQIAPEELDDITVRTTLVWGSADGITPPSTAEQASRLRGWPLHVIADAGHLAVAEQPRQVLTALRSALHPSRDG